MMKQIVWISTVTALLLVSGCGQQGNEEMKKAQSTNTQPASEVKEVKKEESSAKAADAMEKAKEKAAEAVEAAKESAAHMADAAKVKADEAMKEAKKKASEAVDAAKESAAKMAEEAKTKAAEVAETVQDKANEAMSAVTGAKEEQSVEKAATGASAAVASNGAALYAKCAGCHGSDGKTKALGKSPVIAGQSAEQLKKALEEYKAGTRNAYGMGGLMKGQAAGLSESDIAALADYISKL
jgi:cytochrome c553